MLAMQPAKKIEKPFFLPISLLRMKDFMNLAPQTRVGAHRTWIYSPFYVLVSEKRQLFMSGAGRKRTKKK